VVGFRQRTVINSKEESMVKIALAALLVLLSAQEVKQAGSLLDTDLAWYKAWTKRNPPPSW
jgi:hypothetical protein